LLPGGDDAAESAMPESIARTPLAEDRAAGGMCLLVIDMLSDWEFPDAEALLARAVAVAPRIAALRLRCKAAGVPVIYANDNRGRWRSDFHEVVACARKRGGGAARIAAALDPDHDDYFVLKPKHSGFHATPLDLLLRHLKARTLVLGGVSSDQCVLYTAADARMHDYDVIVPRDCVATQSEERNALALRHFAEVLKLETPLAEELVLPATAD
jgi:nicotinamidase-related amidase